MKVLNVNWLVVALRNKESDKGALLSFFFYLMRTFLRTETAALHELTTYEIKYPSIKRNLS